MDEIAELLSAAVAAVDSGPQSSKYLWAHVPTRSEAGDAVYVVATTVDETRQAIATACMLARDRHCKLTVVASRREPVIASCPRAHVYDLPAYDVVSWPDCTEEAARTLLAAVNEPADVLVVGEFTALKLTTVLPSHATVIICGPVGWVLGSPEQRLARKLANRDFDVMFLPFVAHPHAPMHA
jgi:hypothetical protein